MNLKKRLLVTFILLLILPLFMFFGWAENSSLLKMM